MDDDRKGDGETYSLRWRIEQLASTIADQLTGIMAQLDKIDRKIDEKASNARVDALEAKLEEIEDEIVRLRLERAGSAAISGVMKVVFAGVGATVVGSIVSLIVLAVTGGHL